MMDATLVKLLSVSLFVGIVPGEYRAVCPTQPVEAEEGGDVTLQCRLDPQINLSAYTVDVKRADNKDGVHAYRHKQDHLPDQVDQYRDRTTLIHEDLSRGILTLLVSSVQQSDSGPYRFYVPKLNVYCTIDLNVVEKQQQDEAETNDSSTTGPPVEEETEPDDRDDENRKSVRAGIIAAVFFILFVLVVLLVLRMRTIQGRMMRLGGRTDTLDTQAGDGDEDLESPAGNGLGGSER